MATGQQRTRLSREFYLFAALGIVIAVAFASAWPWWWQFTPWADETAASQPPTGVTGFSGGCDAFQVFAQNRWDPVGTTVRAEPNVLSKKVASSSANASIAVDGWVHSRPAYPTNSAPWNSDVWFHVADDSGWVSFAGVCATPVAHDPTGQSSNGGNPAPTNGHCEGSIR